MKKVLYAVPVLAVASFAQTGGGTGATLDQSTITSATSALEAWGAVIVGGIGGIIAVAAGLRLMVKGINRAVGK